MKQQYKQNLLPKQRRIFDHVGEGKSMAPPSFSIMAGPLTIQRSGEDEAVEDNHTYYVAVGDATIRKNTAPHKGAGTGNIPAGTKVKRVMRYDGDRLAKVEQLDVAEGGEAQSWWTTFSNVKLGQTVASSGTFTAFYADIPIMKGPGSGTGTTGNTLTAGAEFSFAVRCNGYVKVSPLAGQVSASGWVEEKALHSSSAMKRSDGIIPYRTWLEARLVEAQAKTGADKINFAKGILGQLEKISNNINQSTPVFPDVETLDKTPSFTSAGNPDLGTFVPHELIGVARQFVSLTEQSEAGVAESADKVVGGSLYSGIDWNSRLGVPQYRTQSDNLLSPEATCAPTSFAIGIERIGIGRADIVKAIDAKVAPGEADEAVIKTKWETKFLEYLDEEEQAYTNRVTAYNDAVAARDAIIEANNALPEEATPAPVPDKPKKDFKSYRRVRGGKEGIAGNNTHEKEVAGIMRASGQLEDLSDFLHWLNGNSSRSSINLKSSANTIFGQVKTATGAATAAKATQTEVLDTKNKLGYANREKIRLALEAGSAVVLSVSHKGNRAFRGHVITVQSIDSKGLIVDDPYGAWNSEYRRGSFRADAYAKKGSTSRKFTYKNKPAYKESGAATPTDYNDADFTAKAGQNLKENESLGNSSRIDFEMINESDGIIGQIYIFNR